MVICISAGFSYSVLMWPRFAVTQMEDVDRVSERWWLLVQCPPPPPASWSLKYLHHFDRTRESGHLQSTCTL